MDKISCDICIDLIPLIKDNVASEDSYKAVMNHIDKCEECRYLLKKTTDEIPKLDDKNVISKIRNQLVIIALALILVGSFIGVAISESEGMFYNVIIMPTIGGISYFDLRKKSYRVPIFIFVLIYIYHFIKYIFEWTGTSQLSSLLIAPLTWSIIYSGLCVLGILIGFLLYIAFRREKE